MTDMILTHKLTKQYRVTDAYPAVDAVNLAVKEGEVMSLLGPNGAGKTTLLALLCGLLPPTSGRATVAGFDVVSESLAVRRLLGVAPEEIALYPQLSGRGNLRYFGGLYGLRGKALAEAMDSALDMVGLTERGNDRVSQYSSGMKRRLNVAVGLIHRPRILFMDEPTAGLDLDGRRSIQELVLRLNKDRGTTVLYCTHHMEEAEAISDRVAIMHHGRIIALGAPHELIAQHLTGKVVRLRLGRTLLSFGTLTAWGAIRGVERVTREGDVVSFVLKGADEPLVEIVDVANRGNLAVRSLIVERPSLEGVFWRLTGQPLTETP
jgi:ABC-2 type transport system ATP-binding protein